MLIVDNQSHYWDLIINDWAFILNDHRYYKFYLDVTNMFSLLFLGKPKLAFVISNMLEVQILNWGCEKSISSYCVMSSSISNDLERIFPSKPGYLNKQMLSARCSK
jgi:hypothetical protein